MKVTTLVTLTSSLLLASGVALADASNASTATQTIAGVSTQPAAVKTDNALVTASAATATSVPADAAAHGAASATKQGATVMKAEQNLKAGEAFLAANQKKAGVVTLPDGLQYKIIQPGTGAKPNTADVVTVNYEGKLIDGKVFDSSYNRGKAVTFPVSGVIEGWQQALQLMKSGATWELYIPAKLAYGEHGAPGVIGPNETLIFKVHLVTVKKQNA